jgi:hypothetical protein
MVRFLRVKFSKLSLSRDETVLNPKEREREREHRGLCNFYSDVRVVMKAVVTWALG